MNKDRKYKIFFIVLYVFIIMRRAVYFTHVSVKIENSVLYFLNKYFILSRFKYMLDTSKNTYRILFSGNL